MLNKSKVLEQESAVVELINKHFWKSKIGPLSAFTIPLFLMIIYRVLSRGDISVFVSGLPAYFAFSILPVSFISLPQMIVEFKTSIILRKISNSRISSLKFMALTLAYNFLMLIGITILIVTLYIVFLADQAIDILKMMKWSQLIYALFNVYISAISIGFLMGVLIQKINMVQIIGFCVVIVSITFSGQFIPIQVLYRQPAIRFVSLLSPISYSLNLMNIALLPDFSNDIIKMVYLGFIVDDPSVQNEIKAKLLIVKQYSNIGVFDIRNPFILFDYSLVMGTKNGISNVPLLSKIKIIKIYEPWQNFLNLTMPYMISIIASLISIDRFKWTSR